MQKKFLTLCAAALLANAGLVQAQVGNGGATYSDVTGKNQWAQLMPQFVDATQNAFTSEALLLTAVGLGDQATALTEQAKGLTRDSAPGQVEQIMTARTSAGTALAAKLATPGLVLEGAAKQQLSEGIDGLVRTIKQYEELSVDLPGMKVQMRGAGAKARTGLFVAKSLPGYVTDAKRELAAMVAYARANTIPVAPEAAALIAP